MPGRTSTRLMMENYKKARRLVLDQLKKNKELGVPLESWLPVIKQLAADISLTTTHARRYIDAARAPKNVRYEFECGTMSLRKAAELSRRARNERRMKREASPQLRLPLEDSPSATAGTLPEEKPMTHFPIANLPSATADNLTADGSTKRVTLPQDLWLLVADYTRQQWSNISEERPTQATFAAHCAELFKSVESFKVVIKDSHIRSITKAIHLPWPTPKRSRKVLAEHVAGPGNGKTPLRDRLTVTEAKANDTEALLLHEFSPRLDALEARVELLLTRLTKE